MDNVIDKIIQNIRTSIFDQLAGTDWIGVRVRASTHRKLSPGESESDLMVQGGCRVR